ncbi:hypothetical protein C5706_33375, partial [Klebsiella pneumoniae]
MLDVASSRHLAFQRMRIKIAVRAFLHAPGNMDIEMLDVASSRHLAFQRMRIKIAVRAFLHAPGNMD